MFGFRTVFKGICLAVLCGLWMPLASAQPPSVDPTADLIHPNWRSFMPRFTAHVCPIPVRDGQHSRVKCGHVLVPEDRRDATSRLIKLSVMVIASPHQSAGAVARLTGGPGVPTLIAPRLDYYTSPAAAHITDVADVILFDQRGVGFSETDLCRAIPRVFQYGVKTVPDGIDAFNAAMSACLADAQARGIDVDAYTTWHNALDVRDIRRALGYEQWAIYGVSYGTALGQAVMMVDAEGVSAAILDSVVPAHSPGTEGWQPTAFGFRSALHAIGLTCSADPQCARDIGDMEARFEAALLALDADPITITGLSPTAYTNGTLVVDGTVAGGAVFQALYRRNFYGDFPSLLYALEARDADALKAYSDALGRSIGHVDGNGMELITNCSGGVISSPEKNAATQAAEPNLSRWVASTEWDALCQGAYKSEPDPSVRTLVSDIPTLLAAGSHDPITPPGATRFIQPGLSNATYVEFPYTGHGALASNTPGCGAELISAFLRDPAGALDTSCVSAVSAPIFLTDLRRTKAPYRFALTLQSGAIPWWPAATALILAFAVIAFPAGATARMLEGRGSPDIGRARALVCVGAATSLGALGLGVFMVIQAGTHHPMALPIGVPSSAALAGWVGVAGAILSAAGLYTLTRRLGAGLQRAGTFWGIILTTAASLSALAFLVRIGMGPV